MGRCLRVQGFERSEADSRSDVFRNKIQLSSGMIGIAVRVPRALERSGIITRMGSTAALESISDIVSLEGELNYDMTAWYTTMSHEPYRLAAVSQLPRLRPEFSQDSMHMSSVTHLAVPSSVCIGFCSSV